MMKSVFALVVLLHLCSSLNKTLSREMIVRLGNLTEVCKQDKLNFTSPDKVRQPSARMIKHAKPSCVGVFAKQLNSLLDNVKVPEEEEHILQELKGNLKALIGYPENDTECPMTSNSDCQVFENYERFLKKLNSKKGSFTQSS